MLLRHFVVVVVCLISRCSDKRRDIDAFDYACRERPAHREMIWFRRQHSVTGTAQHLRTAACADCAILVHV